MTTTDAPAETSLPVERAVAPTAAPAVATTAAPAVATTAVDTTDDQDLLVEDVSIDGMCGVY